VPESRKEELTDYPLKIIDRHGGTIAARSSTGKGAEFIVVLPVRQKKRK
jgi:signal transduction histidine kinase